MTSIKKVEEIPEILHDPNTNSEYQRLRFFGKGGFGKCYEIQCISNNNIYAAKIISKKQMKCSQKQKIIQEITIHLSLSHNHIVSFHTFFEDTKNVYILLELCKQRSMMEMHERRKAITEPETRFYMHEILLGVQYLHSKGIIHRDLKLANLFLDDELHVKIGDFGLATRIESKGERRTTICGTPNYVAPEILKEMGHSFEVDIWSSGCIMYTLLVGKPPFETSTQKDTYNRIKQCRYSIPSSLARKPAADMIALQLQLNPAQRPSVDQLQQHEFFSSGIMPAALPLSCLTTAPRSDQLEGVSLHRCRRPLNVVNSNDINMDMTMNSHVNRDCIAAEPRSVEPASNRQNLIALRDQLTSLLNSKRRRRRRRRPECLTDELGDPAAQPLVWVDNWVDYTEKYGFGYQLDDGSLGVVFNDNTKLILLADGVNVHYINQHDLEQHNMSMREYPQDLNKKMKLLTYFRQFMTENLVKVGASVPERRRDGLSRLPYLHSWVRTTRAVLMYLTNGTLQMNYIEDHTKIILCPLMQAVTYIDVQKNFRTFRFSTIKEHGCDDILLDKLTYALDKINTILLNKVR